MRVGISRNSSGLPGATELVENAVRFGFEGIQYKTKQLVPMEFDAKALSTVHPDAHRLARAGVVFHPGVDFSAWPSKIDDVLRFALPAGSEQVVWVFQPQTDRGDTFPAVAQELHRAGRTFTDEGVQFSFHNRMKSMIGTQHQIRALCELLDPALCRLTYDTAHAAIAGTADLAESIQELAPYIVNIHLKDIDSTGAFCPLGRGVLDLESVLDVLHEMNYQGWLIVDEESAGVSCEEACEASVSFLERNGVPMREDHENASQA